MTLPTPAISAVLEEALQQVGQRRGRRPAAPSQVKPSWISVHQRPRPGEHRLEHHEQDGEQDDEAGHRMQQHGVGRRRAADRAGRRLRTAARSTRSASRWPPRSSPASGARQSAALAGRQVAASRRSSAPSSASVPPRRTATELHHRHAELARQAAMSISMPRLRAMSIMFERHHHRPADLLQLEREAQRQPQVGGVGDADDQVGRALGRELAQHHVARDLLVGRAGAQRIGAGQVDDLRRRGRPAS